MGLEKGALSYFFQSLGRGLYGKKTWAEATKSLKISGVFRQLGSKRPTRVWWLAFTGEGGTEPRFSERGDDHSFIVEEDGAADEIGMEAGTCGGEGDKGNSAAGIHRDKGGGATAMEHGVSDTDLDMGGSATGMSEASPMMLRRWVPQLFGNFRFSLY